MPFDPGVKPPSAPQTEADIVFEQAAWLLRTPERWAKNRLYERRWWRPSRYCLLGAVSRVTKRRYGLSELENRFVKALGDAARARGHTHAVSFNDHPETTHQDVLDLLAVAPAFYTPPF